MSGLKRDEATVREEAIAEGMVFITGTDAASAERRDAIFKASQTVGEKDCGESPSFPREPVWPSRRSVPRFTDFGKE